MDARFSEQGYVGPLRVLTVEQCRRFLRAADDPSRPPPLDWSKGHAASSRAFYEIGAHPAIVDVVAELLGAEVMLWGVSVVDRRPGEAHPWHCDIESSNPAGGTVSVWIGLEHTSRQSTLHIVPGSHRFGVTVQELQSQHGLTRADTTTDDIVRWASGGDRHARVLPMELTDGEAVFFDGRLWHSSLNLTGLTRRALLLQYAVPGTPIRIPDLHSLDWPVRRFELPRPPCLLLRGDADPAANRIVLPPSSAGAGSGPRLTSRVCPLTLPLQPDHTTGWRPYPQFRGSTADIPDLSCHVSVLTQHSCPHPPHTHPEEELLLVLLGEVEVILPQAAGERRRRLGPGQFVYYPAEFPHTLQAVSAQPAEYLMFKWCAAPTAAAVPLCHAAYGALKDAEDAAVQQGFRPRLLFEGPTAWLRKLHCHVSTLSPGAGYEPHVDAYDVALIVLDGEVETLGQRVPSPAVVFYAAGEPHGIQNRGASIARYLVIEFHGSQTWLGTALPALDVDAATTAEIASPAMPLDKPLAHPPQPPSLLTRIRDPQRWKRKLKQALRRVLDGHAPL
jgi:quercetin dioxygenase-like cupin family protein